MLDLSYSLIKKVWQTSLPVGINIYLDYLAASQMSKYLQTYSKVSSNHSIRGELNLLNLIRCFSQYNNFLTDYSDIYLCYLNSPSRFFSPSRADIPKTPISPHPPPFTYCLSHSGQPINQTYSKRPIAAPVVYA